MYNILSMDYCRCRYVYNTLSGTTADVGMCTTLEWNYCRCKYMYHTLSGATADVAVCTTLSVELQ